MTSAPKIPKRLGHIWIGPKPAPDLWMQTWPALHPDWEYTVYDNDFLAGFPFRLRPQINEYFWRGYYAGVQDMMRYEILYEFGGFMADADAICKHPIDDLLVDGTRAYTVYDRPEGDKFRAVCPILAAPPRHPFLKTLIDHLAQIDPADLRKPEVSTGNRFLGHMLREHDPKGDAVTIWPMHYFLPWHKSDPSAYYDGPDTVYAEQQYGTSLWAYNRGAGETSATASPEILAQNRASMIDRLIGAQGRPQSGTTAADTARMAQASTQALKARALEGRADFVALRAGLDAHLEAAMRAANLPAQFHGLHYFRPMQAQALRESRLKTRSAALRAQIIGWIASARRVALVGFDTGHLPLAAHLAAPEVTLHAIEPCRWHNDKDQNPPRKKIYAPAAAEFLTRHLPAHQAARVGDPAQWAQEFGAGGGYDLVVLANADQASLRDLRALAPLMTPDGVVVIAADRKDEALSQAHRLAMLRMAYGPMEQFQSQNDAGGYVALRLREGAALRG